MAVGDWDTDPGSNTTLSGINLAENNMTPASINNAFRQVMADVKVFYDGIPVVTDKMDIAGGTFTGDILRDTRGAFLHHADPSATSGRVFEIAEGDPDPANLLEGDIVIEYAP